MARLTARGWLLAAVSVIYAAIAIPVGIHKGLDLEIHIKVAQGMLAGQPVYTAAPSIGVWWPPFAILALTPFALLANVSMALAKGVFAGVGVACLSWSIARFGREGRPYLALAITAVAVPIQINFDYLNINAVLLALVVAAGFDLARGRDARAGVWLGLATALKAFPALLLVYVAYQRRWRAAAIGVSVALGLSVCALLLSGVSGALTSAQVWLANSSTGGWVLHPRNQSLPALLGRAGLPNELAIAIDLLLLVLAAVALRRAATHDDVVRDVGIVILLAVLVSPIGWDHYYMLAFPAWVAALSRAPAAWTRGTRITLLAAGIATSGLLTNGSATVRGILRAHSMFAWGGLALLLVLLVERWRAPSVPAAAEPLAQGAHGR